MAQFFGTWIDGFLEVNGVDLSDHVREMSLDTSVEEVPDNTHGKTTAIVIAGLDDWTIQVTFLQDFASGKVDETLSGLGGAGHTQFPVIIGPDATAAVSATNPRYSGNAILASYRPFGGAHGTNMEATATFRPGDDLARLTS